MIIFLFDNTTAVVNRIKIPVILSDEAVDEVREAYYCFENGDKSSFGYKKFIDCVYKCANLNVAENIITDSRVKAAITYIQSNLQEPITCRDVANHIFLSEGRFSRIFKEQVGMTFSGVEIERRGDVYEKNSNNHGCNGWYWKGIGNFII